MKRPWLILLLVVVLLLGWLTISLIRPREPSYQGRPLSSWIAEYNNPWSTNKSRQESMDDELKAKNAIKAIGTKAIPSLLLWIQTRDTPLKEWSNAQLNRQHLIRYRFPKALDRQNLGLAGFRVLGNDAASAIPALLPLTKSSDRDQRGLALYSLYLIDRPKKLLLPVYVQMLHSSYPDVQNYGAVNLRNEYPEAAEKAGVYDLFPDLKPSPAKPAKTNTPAAQ